MWGKGILIGMSITMRNMLRGPITVKYPFEKVELPERARWAVVPTYAGDGAPLCTACMVCIKECPDNILALQVETREDKSKRIVRYSYEIGACMMCGLCVEACPFDAIAMGQDYELARLSKDELVVDLLAGVDAASPRRAPAGPRPGTVPEEA